MRQAFSSALRPAYGILLAAVALLFLNECACIPLFFGAALIAFRHPDWSLGWAVNPAGLIVVANTWALAWTAKTAHFVGLFGRWPTGAAGRGGEDGIGQGAGPGGGALGLDAEVPVIAAGNAFDQGDFQKVEGLLRHLPEERWLTVQWLGLGRSLALEGRMEESALALEKGGEDRRVVAWMRPRQGWGRLFSAHFRPSTAARIARTPWMAAFAAALALGTVLVAGAAFRQLRLAEVRPPSFDTSAFQTEVVGRFTVRYHNPEFRDKAASIAEAALDHDLAFLGLPADAFGPGAVNLFLCDSEEEYRQRAPTHPSWEAACAVPPARSVYIYRFPDSQQVYFEVVLAHELGHVCYFRLIGSSPDDWLNEGLADYLGYHFGLERAGIARQAWLQDRYFLSLRSRALPFDRFFRTDPHQLPGDQVGVFYQQGFSVVYLLIEDYGREPFLKFLREYTLNKNVDAALASAFPTIPTVQALAAVWALFYPRDAQAQAGP